MKSSLTYSLIVISFFCISFTQINDVVNALKKGNADQLLKYVDKTVNITLPDKTNTFSKSQAELVLKDFFKNNAVKDFELTAQNNTSKVQYISGTLQTQSGDYKTTIYIKQKADKQFLHEIKFEK